MTYSVPVHSEDEALIVFCEDETTLHPWLLLSARLLLAFLQFISSAAWVPPTQSDEHLAVEYSKITSCSAFLELGSDELLHPVTKILTNAASANAIFFTAKDLILTAILPM